MSGKTTTRIRAKSSSDVRRKAIDPEVVTRVSGKRPEKAIAEPLVKVTAPERKTLSAPVTGLFLHDHICVFDRHWYLRTYPDVAAAGMDAVEHYRTVGHREGRMPNRFFDPQAYRAAHPDLAQYEDDLFLHYVFFGAIEGRNIR